jgi:hypothetical protein
MAHKLAGDDPLAITKAVKKHKLDTHSQWIAYVVSKFDEVANTVQVDMQSVVCDNATNPVHSEETRIRACVIPTWRIIRQDLPIDVRECLHQTLNDTIQKAATISVN